MKKGFKLLSICLMLIVLLTSCTTEGGGEVNPPHVDKITVNTVVSSIDIKTKEVKDFVYNSYFKITENGSNMIVANEYIDSSKVKEEPGTYDVICTYKKEKAVLKVNVTESVYEVNLKVAEINVSKAMYDKYDYLSLFEAFIDGEAIEITPDMIKSDITNEIGKYSFTVTNHNVSKTLIVNITDTHQIEVVPAYNVFEIEISKLASFDFTKLFTLYIDGESVKVTTDMVDSSDVTNPELGKTYKVNFSYSLGASTATSSVTVKPIEKSQVSVKAKNIVTYPNASIIDLTTLFEIKKGNQIIPVTPNMITGSIDYSKVGNNEITLNYDGKTYVANVEVRIGVVIDYQTTDTVVIIRGTNQNTYHFANDFKVMINGVRFNKIPESYLDLSNVDFSKEGTYQVKITIPYNEKPFGLSGVSFTYFTKTINYVVVNNDYEINVLEEQVIVNKDDTTFNEFKNVEVFINGKKQTLTTKPEYVDSISCYAKVLSDAIDFTKTTPQEVKLAIYANGVKSEPIIVTYEVIIDFGISVKASSKVIFTGSTLYKEDLFTVLENGKEVEVTPSMIEGIFDPFTPGIYYLELDYKGVKASSKVIVFDNNLKGTYRTTLRTFKQPIDNIGDDDEPIKPTTLPRLIISENGEIKIGEVVVDIIDAVDEGTMIVKYNGQDFTMHYENGIIVLIPDNSFKLTFANSRRPLVYINEEVWSLGRRFTINSGSQYVLELNYLAYSIDVFDITNRKTNEHKYFALKTQLIEKHGSDTSYEITYGFANFPSSFKRVARETTSFTFNDNKYQIIMNTDLEASIVKTEPVKEYRGMTFTGKINGVDSRLVADQYENFSLYIGSEKVFSLISNEINSLSNGGIDYENGIIILYGCENNVFSYKFKVNKENSTFEYIEKDNYYGKYETENMYIFLDGYGKGLVNFNTKYYIKNQLVYTTNGNYIEGRFINTKPSFEYGKNISLYIDPFMNKLSIKDISDKSLIETELVNNKITKGAIVNISSYLLNINDTRNTLLDKIEIITKDGVLSIDEKKKCVDTAKIRFNQAGFYQLKVTIDINGEKVSTYYAVQILDNIYENNPLAVTYGSGVLFDTNSFVIDKYGLATLNCNGIIFTGTVKINPDKSFVAHTYNNKNEYVLLTGKIVENGLILMRATGAVSFTDYFTTGEKEIAGTLNHVLKRITLKDKVIYIYSKNLSSIGDIILVESVSESGTVEAGDIAKLTTSEGVIYVLINSWNDGIYGLTVSDEYRGTYTLKGKATITLDGFGKLTVNKATGKYVLNGNAITAILGDKVEVYKLDKETSTYEIVNIALDNTLLSGKTFSASHIFLCNEYAYTADTSFIFKEGNKVIVKSTSLDHDSGDNACGVDTYKPSFASKNGIEGTFLVKGNTVTVNINSETFVFEINNVLNPSKITCLSTTVIDNEHGYFEVGTVFRID